MTPGSCLINQTHIHHASLPSVILVKCFYFTRLNAAFVFYFCVVPEEVISLYILVCCLDKVPLCARPYGEQYW